MARGGRGSGDGDAVMVGSWYQDSDVTVGEVLGILGVILGLVVVGWLAFGRGGATVITPEDVAQAPGDGVWPFTVLEVHVDCAEDGPVLTFVGGGERWHVDGGIAAIPEELRRVDHDGGGFVSTGAFARLAREVCPT